MTHAKFSLGMVLCCLFVTHLEAAESEPRTLDKPCNYNLTVGGNKPTYRELLSELLHAYKTYATDAQKDQVVVEMQKAMELFGNGPKPYMDYGQWVNQGFDYTLFKQSKGQFYNKITDKDFPWPLKIPCDQVYGYNVYDAHYALLGILQYNAYQSTGGDS